MLLQHLVTCSSCRAPVDFSTRATLECACGGREFQVEIVGGHKGTVDRPLDARSVSPHAPAERSSNQSDRSRMRAESQVNP